MSLIKTMARLLRAVLRYLKSRPKPVKLLLLALSVLLILTNTDVLQILESNAAEPTQNENYAYYQGDGDFNSDGDLGKQYAFYKYISDFDEFDWSNLRYMTVNAVSDGTRLQYRITGYKSGGGGTLIFDSGWHMYATAVQVEGAGFDYYLLELREYDENGQQVQIGYIDSIVTYFGYSEVVQLPTTPPELVTGVQDIQSAIVGGEIEEVTTDTADLPSYNSGDISDTETPSAITGFFSLFAYCVSWLFGCHPLLSSCLTLFIVLALVGYILYGRGG